jgi:hypothetical protein
VPLAAVSQRGPGPRQRHPHRRRPCASRPGRVCQGGPLRGPRPALPVPGSDLGRPARHARAVAAGCGRRPIWLVHQALRYGSRPSSSGCKCPARGRHVNGGPSGPSQAIGCVNHGPGGHSLGFGACEDWPQTRCRTEGTSRRATRAVLWPSGAGGEVPDDRSSRAQLPVHCGLAYTRTGAATSLMAGGSLKLPPSCTPASLGRARGSITMAAPGPGGGPSR